MLGTIDFTADLDTLSPKEWKFEEDLGRHGVNSALGV